MTAGPRVSNHTQRLFKLRQLLNLNYKVPKTWSNLVQLDSPPIEISCLRSKSSILKEKCANSRILALLAPEIIKLNLS